MTHQIVTIKLLGSEHKIKCDASQEELLKAAAIELSKKVKKARQKNNLSLNDATLLTALNLCAEQLGQQQKNTSPFSEEERQTLDSLNKKINIALTET